MVSEETTCQRRHPPAWALNLNNFLRHLFLYQKSLLVCKKQENTGDYSFKLELPLESLQINEEKGKLNRFTLVSKTGRFLLVSVMTRDAKISWIREIKRAITTLQVF